MDKEITVLEANLSVRFNDKAIADLSDQRKALHKFVQSQLIKDVDYGIIPGVKKPSLYKPGAEKLANLFQLGSRIIKNERTLDLDRGYGEFDVTIEVFHLPTNKAISQCNAICSSAEKKYLNRPVGDVLNTLTKMAQKRAYVGAIIIAVGASDFFTQDVEDMPEQYAPPKAPNPHAPTNMQPGPEDGDPSKSWGYTFGYGKWKMKSLEQVHREFGLDKMLDYADWLEENSQKTGKPLSAAAMDSIHNIRGYARAVEGRGDQQ